MRNVYEQRYTTYISEINFRISSMISDFEVRRDLIDKDLEINFTKLEQQLEDLRRQLRKSYGLDPEGGRN